MNKKAVDQQIFVYIFAMLVIALTIFFGIKVILGVNETAKGVETAVFKSEVDNIVQKFYTYSPGSKAKLEVKGVPAGIKAVCFIDLTTPLSLANIPYDDVKLLAQANEGSRRNVFFARSSSSYATPEPIEIPKLKPSPNPLCIMINLQQILEAKLENEGTQVTIK